jgi:hypothetical protein
LRRPAAERRAPPSEEGLRNFRNAVSEANEPAGASARAERSARDAYASMPAAADLDRPPRGGERFNDFDRAPRPADQERTAARALERAPAERPEPRGLDREETPEPQEADEAQPHQDFSEPMLESSYALDEARPAAGRSRRAQPPPLEEDEDSAPARPRRSWRGLIKASVAAILLLAVVGALAWQWPAMVEYYRAFRAPSTEVARETASPASPKKTQERIEPGSQASTPAPSGQQAAVAQKVVLYEEDPADPNGKRFVGSAIWRTETITPAPGQPPELAVRADVEVPERKLAMTWSFRRNTDKGLPATHTVEITFKVPADFPAGGINNVPGILMKQAESTRGVPLAGLAVKVTPGFYLIGLSNLDQDRDRNLQLLKERGWFDIPVVYNNNRRAILAMEKGTPGDRAFADAFKAWKQ